MGVLADGRLVLMWSIDNHPQALLVSTGSDWTEPRAGRPRSVDGQVLTLSTLWEQNT